MNNIRSYVMAENRHNWYVEKITGQPPGPDCLDKFDGIITAIGGTLSGVAGASGPAKKLIQNILAGHPIDGGAAIGYVISMAVIGMLVFMFLYTIGRVAYKVCAPPLSPEVNFENI